MTADQTARTDLGIVGVGAIAEAITVGLCDGSTDAPSILLSPRNAVRSAALAERFGSVRVADHVQRVVDETDLVVVCVRPQDATTVLDGLMFPAGRPVISVMAGLSMAAVGDLVAPATVIARAIPLPAVARRRGVTVVHPADERAVTLFERLGDTMTTAGEAGLDALSASTGTIAAHLAQLVTISDWLVGRGVAAEDASRFVGGVYAGVAEPFRASTVDFGAMAADYATPGGLNELYLATLRAGGLDQVLVDGLERLIARLEDGT